MDSTPLPFFSEESVSPSILSPVRKTSTITVQTTRAPMSIISDAQFTSANGVIGGTGTEQEPYVIANWFIVGNDTSNCIQIVNTTSYFIIENCILINATNVFAGILLKNTSNSHLKSNNCSTNYMGIRLESCTFITLTNNTCNSNSWGINLQDSSTNTLTNNTCYNNSMYGIRLFSFTSDPTNNTLANNTCNSNVDGIRLVSGSSNTLIKNTCNINSRYGFYLGATSSNTLTNNICSSNSEYGIYLAYCSLPLSW